MVQQRFSLGQAAHAARTAPWDFREKGSAQVETFDFLNPAVQLVIVVDYEATGLYYTTTEGLALYTSRIAAVSAKPDFRPIKVSCQTRAFSGAFRISGIRTSGAQCTLHRTQVWDISAAKCSAPGQCARFQGRNCM